MLIRHLIPLVAALAFLLVAPLQAVHAGAARPVEAHTGLAQAAWWFDLAFQRAEPAATLQSDGWAIVERIVGPELLEVQNARGEQFRVWHLGVMGPDPMQGNWRARATELHAQLLQPGTRVWLEIEHGAKNDSRGRWVYRHVYRENAPGEPIGAELLRSGMTWVFPHTSHGFIPAFANDQAVAVSERAGLWSETQSSAIFQPQGATYGGFPIDPRVLPALKLLDNDPLGKEVLTSVNDFPVEIGVSQLQHGVLGVFIVPFYSIQLNASLLEAAPESIAAVLVHELVHARQAINAGVLDVDPGCFENEIEAFEATANFWADLYGAGGKRPPTHWLDNTLNATLRDFNNKRLARNVREAYGHQCGAFVDGTTVGEEH